MLVSSAGTCPNPALLGPKLSPIEITQIESALSSMEISKPTSTTDLPSLHNIAIVFITFFGISVVAAKLHNARISYLANKISSLGFPPGSDGERLRDGAAKIIQDFSLLQKFTSLYPQKAYDLLTDTKWQNYWNADLYQTLQQVDERLPENGHFQVRQVNVIVT
jgi:hypothetical protein